MIGILSRALDASSLRQQTISNNIANIGTPNFQPMRVSFEEMLQKELKSSFAGKRMNEKHIAIGNTNSVLNPVLVKQTPIMGNSRNGVDVDYEMTEMAQNSVWYQSLIHGVNAEFTLLTTAIKG